MKKIIIPYSLKIISILNELNQKKEEMRKKIEKRSKERKNNK